MESYDPAWLLETVARLREAAAALSGALREEYLAKAAGYEELVRRSLETPAITESPRSPTISSGVGMGYNPRRVASYGVERRRAK